MSRPALEPAPAAIGAATMLVLGVLYAPQSILPVLAEVFQVPQPRAALLITVSLVPLSVAPLLYGYLLESTSSVRMLRIALLGLAATEAAFALARSFEVLLGLRLLQGLLIPAALTAALTHLVATAAEGRRQQMIAVYVACSVTGGFLGRLLSVVFASYFSWRAFFGALAVVLLLSALALPRASVALHVARPGIRVIGRVLRQPVYLRVYLLIFCSFFAFAALLNFIPFRLAEIRGHTSGLIAGFVYTGFLLGAAAAMSATRLTTRFGGARPLVVGALLVFLGGLGLMAVPAPAVLFGAFFFVCGAMFLVHTLAAGAVNELRRGGNGVVNGIYVSFYYAGAVAGSSLPGLVYVAFGWQVFLLVLGVMVTAALALALAALPRPARARSTRMDTALATPAYPTRAKNALR